jgi:hypothetical protein
MDDSRLKYIARVRDLRAKLAFGEVMKRRHLEVRAERALEEARQRRRGHETRAARAGSWDSAAADSAAESSFRAEEAHHLMSYVTGARLQVREGIALIRRAELTRERAREIADDAHTEYRQAALRHEALRSRWQRGQKALRRKQLEREDESIAEEQVHRWKAGA